MPRIAAVAGACLGGIAVLIARGRRRARALGALERTARELAGGVADASGDTGAVAAADPDLTPAELRPLRAALAELGERTERQWKEAAKKTRNLETVIEVMDEPLLATDDRDRVLLCNRSAEAIFDAEPGALIGRPISEVFTHSDLLDMHAAAKAGGTLREKVRVTTPLGKRTLQVSASPVPAAWGGGVFGAVMILRDVTELDQAVQVKTDFVANASHELRTPVSAIRGAAETLQGAAADDPEMAERLRQMIITHAARLEEMLRDLLDLSRLESPDAPVQPGAIDLDELRQSLRTLFEEVCRERRLELRFELDDDLVGMRTDRKLLTLVLRNLIENATKFAHEGTTVRVSGSLVEAELPAGDARLAHARQPGPRPTRGVVRLEVADRGIGIPLNQQERVFERYYQVDQARTSGVRRGTGLGLAIVKHAAKRLEGRVGLSSVWGQGTTAFVEIPVGFEPLADGGAAKQVS